MVKISIKSCLFLLNDSSQFNNILKMDSYKVHITEERMTRLELN